MNKQILEVLKKIEEQNVDNQFWCVSKETGEFLYFMVKLFGAKNILEIGTGIGSSAIWLAGSVGKNGRVITIDSFEKRAKLAKENIEQAGLKNVQFLLGHAPEIFGELQNLLNGETLDLIFMDASKKDYKKFYLGLKPYFSKRVLLIADNVQSHAHFVQDYLELVRAEGQSIFLPIGSGLEVSLVEGVV